MIENIYRLHPRSPANTGICVDHDGAMLGPDYVLVDRTRHGFRSISREAALALQKCVLGGERDDDWLFRQCERISDALNKGEVALAQIYGLRISTRGIDDKSLKRLPKELTKWSFNPDEPRIPKGDPHGGEWTTESDGTTTVSPNSSLTGPNDNEAASFEAVDDISSFLPSLTNTTTNSDIIPVAYPGDYHDIFVQGFSDYITARGGTVVTSVPLTGVDGTTAIADLIVKMPGIPPFVVEVKTGISPTFTPAQAIIYPMLQVGGHVSSPKEAITSLGLTPGQPLPPLDVWIYRSLGPNGPHWAYELSPPEFVP